MPIHDWTRVDAGTFHDFHNGWLIALRDALNVDLLPDTHYAQTDRQSRGDSPDSPGGAPDVLTLERAESDADGGLLVAADGSAGGVAVADAPPKRSLVAEVDAAAWYAARRRTLAIKGAADDRPVAILEVASPGNKDRRESVGRFADKCVGALQGGLHLVVIDPHPPRSHDAGGLAMTVAREAGLNFAVPDDRRVPAASFEAAEVPTGYAEPFDVGDELPWLPLFYRRGWYVKLPLEETYQAAYRGVAKRWKRVLEA